MVLTLGDGGWDRAGTGADIGCGGSCGAGGAGSGADGGADSGRVDGFGACSRAGGEVSIGGMVNEESCCCNRSIIRIILSSPALTLSLTLGESGRVAMDGEEDDGPSERIVRMSRKMNGLEGSSDSRC